MRRSLLGWDAGVGAGAGWAGGVEGAGCAAGGGDGSDGLSADGPVVGDWLYEGTGGGPERGRGPGAVGGTSTRSMSLMPSASIPFSRVWTNAIWRLSGDQAGRSSLNSGALVRGWSTLLSTSRRYRCRLCPVAR